MSTYAYQQILRGRRDGLTDEQIADTMGCSVDDIKFIAQTGGGSEVSIEDLKGKLKRKALEVLEEVLNDSDNRNAQVAAAKLILTDEESDLPQDGKDKLSKMLEQMKRVTDRANILQLPESSSVNHEVAGAI